MNLITVDQARAHCKADAADDTMLTIYANAAEKACERAVNRNVYVDADARDAAIAAIPAAMTAAFAAYDAAKIAADALTDARDQDVAYSIACEQLAAAQLDQTRTVNSIIADDDYIAAVLLTLGSLYVTREDEIVGQGATAAKLPNGAAALLWPHRWVGSLA